MTRNSTIDNNTEYKSPAKKIINDLIEYLTKYFKFFKRKPKKKKKHTHILTTFYVTRQTNYHQNQITVTKTKSEINFKKKIIYNENLTLNFLLIS